MRHLDQLARAAEKWRIYERILLSIFGLLKKEFYLLSFHDKNSTTICRTVNVNGADRHGVPEAAEVSAGLPV